MFLKGVHLRSISYNSIPRAQISTFSVCNSLLYISGAMYSRVPQKVFLIVLLYALVPKSASLGL